MNLYAEATPSFASNNALYLRVSGRLKFHFHAVASNHLDAVVDSAMPPSLISLTRPGTRTVALPFVTVTETGKSTGCRIQRRGMERGTSRST